MSCSDPYAFWRGVLYGSSGAGFGLDVISFPSHVEWELCPHARKHVGPAISRKPETGNDASSARARNHYVTSGLHCLRPQAVAPAPERADCAAEKGVCTALIWGGHGTEAVEIPLR